ncbi:MAG: hypothetical protein JJV92_07845 [Desulfosarcina sp.]|nr:hypothetical protein [Desulfobacterales bacterium]
MRLSGKERQQKWRKKQKTLGNKPYTIMLGRKAQSILENEKKRTGRSLSTIIEKALLHLAKSISDNKQTVIENR